jgi:hypothetical protein
MTTPRGTYNGGYYTSPFFTETPIYDSLVAERGTPQIAPIRVPAAYDTGSNLPALPSALPALPAAPSPQPPGQGGYNGYQHNGYQQQPAQLQQAPAPYIPQQQAAQRGGYNSGYNGGYNAGYNGNPTGSYPQQQAPNQYQGPAGYEAARPQPPRPAAPRPAAPAGYGEEPYQRRNLGQGVPPTQSGGGYYQG